MWPASQAIGLGYIYEKQKLPQSRQISQSRFPGSWKIAEIKERHHAGTFKVWEGWLLLTHRFRNQSEKDMYGRKGTHVYI